VTAQRELRMNPAQAVEAQKPDGGMRFQQRLAQGKFTLTCEISPPKGTDAGERIAEAQTLKGRVDAVAVTDGKGSVMVMSALALAHLLQDHGWETLLYLSCRDRSRMALQAELLGAAALGIRNLVAVTGDSASLGDHPQTKPVFDLDSVQLLRAVQGMREGKDMMGNPLHGSPDFFVGATVSPVPGSEAALDLQLMRMEKKIAAGARFFQTQPVFDLARFERFLKRASGLGVPLLAGVMPLKSVSMARFINKNMPEMAVPEDMIDELSQAADRVQVALSLCGRTLRQVRNLCPGAHLIPAGWEKRIPAILDAARL
jgi:methylenetetrahydrofolate reductase (NADPH)